MSELIAALSALRRPRLMIRAAKLGMQDYRRERDLRRLIGATTVLKSGESLAALMAAEAEAEEVRRAGEAGYNITRHLGLLIALLAEAQLLKEPRAAL